MLTCILGNDLKLVRHPPRLHGMFIPGGVVILIASLTITFPALPCLTESHTVHQLPACSVNRSVHLPGEGGRNSRRFMGASLWTCIVTVSDDPPPPPIADRSSWLSITILDSKTSSIERIRNSTRRSIAVEGPYSIKDYLKKD